MLAAYSLVPVSPISVTFGAVKSKTCVGSSQTCESIFFLAAQMTVQPVTSLETFTPSIAKYLGNYKC